MVLRSEAQIREPASGLLVALRAGRAVERSLKANQVCENPIESPRKPERHGGFSMWYSSLSSTGGGLAPAQLAGATKPAGWPS